MMTDQEKENILVEARLKYPIGTRFDSTGGTRNCIINDNNFWWDGTSVAIKILYGEDKTKGTGRVYNSSLKGWAIILTQKPVNSIINNYSIF